MNFLQKLLTKTSDFKTTTVKGPNQLMYFLGFIVFCLVLPLVICFLIYKQVARSLLFLYHGRKFKGFVSSSDLYWAHESSNQRSIINFILFVSSDKDVDMFSIMRHHVQKVIFDNPKDYEKLLSTKHKFMGYTYLLPSSFPIDDVVKTLETDNNKNTITEEEYKKIVSEIAYKPFPKDDTALWEVHVCNKRIYTEDQTKSFYPIHYRIHHLIGDGASMVALSARLWSESLPEFYLDKIKIDHKQSTSAAFGQTLVAASKSLLQFIYFIYAFMGSIIWMQHVREKDRNALHGTKLTDEKLATWYLEHEPSLVPLIKKLKNNVPNGAFSDVLYTALSASFTEYFKKKSQPIPDEFVIGNALIYASRNIGHTGPAILENNTCFTFLTVPTQTTSLYDTLLQIGERNREIKKGLDIKINLWSLKYLIGIFPEPLLAQLSYIGGVTTVVSNVPGGSKMDVVEGRRLDNVIFFALNRYRTGIALSILTMDDRMQIGIVVDKVLVNRRKDLDFILQSFLKHLHLLGEEVAYRHEHLTKV